MGKTQLSKDEGGVGRANLSSRSRDGGCLCVFTKFAFLAGRWFECRALADVRRLLLLSCFRHPLLSSSPSLLQGSRVSLLKSCFKSHVPAHRTVLIALHHQQARDSSLPSSVFRTHAQEINTDIRLHKYIFHPYTHYNGFTTCELTFFSHRFTRFCSPSRH